MNRLLTSTLVAGLGLAVALAGTNDAAAKGPKGGSGGKSHHTGSYHHTHNHKGQHHNWSSWYWNRRYGCYYYWSSLARCYYYWYAPGSCYYPVECIDQYPPTEVAYRTPTAGTAPLPLIQVTNVNQNGALPVSRAAVPGP